jgi:meso-butanediol dehydrogenase/(S,S)-butanediol dehydrogenase/diacetyl reductase
MVLEISGRFKDKVVAITGGVSGTGAALTRRYVAEGAKVLVADLCDPAKGEAFASEFPAGTVIFHHCDISTPEAATSVVTTTIEKFGDLDIVHNNAAFVGRGKIPDMDVEHWAQTYRVCIEAPFHICRAAIRHMRTKGKGAIVNTVSTAGLVGDTGLGCYGSAKAALANLTRSMAVDHAHEGIRINAVAPGLIDTPATAVLNANPETKERVTSSTPMRRFADPREIAAVGMFLASDDASFVTGSGIYVPSFTPSVSPTHHDLE